MVTKNKQENSEIIEKSIQHLEYKGFENIKADIAGYPTPKSYLNKERDTKITPDIVAEKNGRTYFFEISLKTNKESLLKSKLLFLDALSRMNSNRFKIITTKGHYRFTDSILSALNLSVKTPIRI
ncbi:Hypothetical protein I595_2892 [Croceitalea dokdonensis DOKDO 023]|uniref:Uncharacterized protein n=1 Tax=Croceitalea dokdonensis DOKDO 023 TaxID=1300341 RepID=A0A0P7AX48_9FLAO|nr:hypothetical protein [Croceitalea dokdonensis]KPM30914.1 Hypothetical protein I595_2892 [Croceitalea dokdonensis DOKDO 023]